MVEGAFSEEEPVLCLAEPVAPPDVEDGPATLAPAVEAPSAGGAFREGEIEGGAVPLAGTPGGT